MVLLREVAYSCLGVHYKWGGSHPLEGFDCSGLIQYLLASCGMDPPGDQTAQALFDHFSQQGTWGRLSMGSLLFFGASTHKISHIGMALDNFRMIEAAHGDSTTITLDDAKKKGACVKISMIKRRKDLVATIFPSYTSIGLI